MLVPYSLYVQFAYKRISSLDPSHDPSAYMAEIGCRSSTETRNTIVCTNTGSEILKHIPKWRESGHLCKITGQPSRQIVPSFAARFSGVFAYVEATGDKRGNYLEIAHAAACHIHNLSWLGFSSSRTGLMNVPKSWDVLHVFNNLARIMFWVEREYT